MNKRVRLRKVHIESFLDILHELYNKGVDYIDIEGTEKDGQDSITLSFKDSYVDPEYMDELVEFMESLGIPGETDDEIEQSPIEVKRLTDEDINQLL